MNLRSHYTTIRRRRRMLNYIREGLGDAMFAAFVVDHLAENGPGIDPVLAAHWLENRARLLVAMADEQELEPDQSVDS